MIRRFLQGLAQGATAGLLGGAVVGLAEAVVRVWDLAGIADRSALPAAAIGYGLLGAVPGGVAGALVGLARGRDGPDAVGVPAFAAGFVVPCGAIAAAVLARAGLERGGAPFPPGALPWGVPVFAAGIAVVWVLVAALVRKTLLAALLRPGTAVGAWIGLGVLALLGTVGGQPAASVDEAARGEIPDTLAAAPDIVYVMVDCLRRDALGTYGAPADRTPNLDALARDGVTFGQAVAQSNSTGPSTASQLSGLFPPGHGVLRPGDALPPGAETLAEVLLARGYYTGALVNSPLLGPALGFGQGMKSFRLLPAGSAASRGRSAAHLSLLQALQATRQALRPEQHADAFYWDADRVTEAATEWLDHYATDRIFLFVHYMDPHPPWFARPYDGTAASPPPAEEGQGPDRAALAALYAGEVASVDAGVGRLIAHLKARGRYDSAVLVVTSDHGEELGDHGAWGHGTRLYDEQIHVPLILKLPSGREAGTRRHEVVRHVDLAPTLADLSGGGPDASWQGVSLLDDWQVRRDKDKAAWSYAEVDGLRIESLRDAAGKLVRAPGAGRLGLPERAFFDLRADPAESRDLSATDDPATVARIAAYANVLAAIRDAATHHGRVGLH